MIYLFVLLGFVCNISAEKEQIPSPLTREKWFFLNKCLKIADEP
jgi:hypothetical protein